MSELVTEKRWSLKSLPEDEVVDRLAKEVNVRPELARLLLQRGIKDYESAKAFFRPSLEDLHDPFLMKDMDKAVDRLSLAISEGENIMVYGDYDVDGTTSVALVYSFLKEHTDSIMYYIPDRYTEGYGLSAQGIDQAADNDVSLIITLDCGIKAVEKVDYAKTKGIDIIICDHHRPGDILPPAVAILDAKQDGCEYPYKELCGCGVGFKFMQAFSLRHDLDQNTLFDYLDLVATAIGADIVPITGENRVLMTHGLNMVNTRPSGGIKALLQVADVKKRLSVTDLVFIVAPRINAAGRIFHGNHAVALLTSEDLTHLEEVAKEVNTFNQERKELDRAITEQALDMISADEDQRKAKTTVVYKEDWHKGVVGIVASRLTETYYRPTIVLTESNGMVTGSARSVRHFDVYDAIDACSDLLVNFGGHKYAAGLTMELDNLSEFQKRFEEVVSSSIAPELLIPEVITDLYLELDHVDRKFYNVIKQMAPFGPGNMRPVFRSGPCLGRYAKIVGDKHLKFQAYQEDANRVLNCIAFNHSDKLELLNSGRSFDMLYSVEENEWNGMVSLQLNIKDIRPTD
ncbi:MAG: single-stranded-DNA-specific exonuclease RecJ [Flavobacteriales bacterium]|nr:single-stranded-DNA-specific exonuclease RecJ [Flavobacteriales bacterium]NNK80158.1 single-stranded-DNA-specific exonuclease RecJ [Flavobacteriales bacterium]